MNCNICLTEVDGYQWGIVGVIVDDGWVDVADEVSFFVHPYCMIEGLNNAD